MVSGWTPRMKWSPLNYILGKSSSAKYSSSPQHQQAICWQFIFLKRLSIHIPSSDTIISTLPQVSMVNQQRPHFPLSVCYGKTFSCLIPLSDCHIFRSTEQELSSRSKTTHSVSVSPESD